MENSNTDYQNQGSNNTHDKNYRVTSVVPNNYKQRSNFATFGIVLLIFLVLGGSIAAIYYLAKDKIDTATDEFIKAVTEEFEEDDNTRNSGSNGNGGVHLSPDDLDIDIETPSIDMPNFDDIQSKIDDSLRQADKMRGRDTEIDIEDYLTFDTPDYLKTTGRETEYGYSFVMNDSDTDSTLQVYLYALEDVTDASDFAKSRLASFGNNGKIETYKANHLTWYSVETNVAIAHRYLYTQIDGKVFELEILFSENNADKVEEIITSIREA